MDHQGRYKTPPIGEKADDFKNPQRILDEIEKKNMIFNNPSTGRHFGDQMCSKFGRQRDAKWHPPTGQINAIDKEDGGK